MTQEKANKNNIKLVFTANTSFYLYNFRIDLMHTLASRGFTIYALAPSDEFSDLLSKYFIYKDLKFLHRRNINPLIDLQLFYEFTNLYQYFKPSLVINFTIKPNIYSSLACAVLNIPSISVISGLGYVFIHSLSLKRLVRIMYKVALKRNKFVVVQNSDDYKIISQLISSNKVVLIPGSGVNTNQFNPDKYVNFKIDFWKNGHFLQENSLHNFYEYTHNFSESCEEIEIKKCIMKYSETLHGVCKNSKHFIFLFIGRFLISKGVCELVQAAQKLFSVGYQFELWLLGSVDYDNPASLANDDIKSLKDIKFIKIFPFAKDTRPFIALADCVILPSYREGVPMVLLEAMAMEKPIITTNAVGCNEVIVDEYNGYVANVRDFLSLFNAMKRMISLSADERKKMGQNGRKMVLEKYDKNKIIPMYISLIEKSIRD